MLIRRIAIGDTSWHFAGARLASSGISIPFDALSCSILLGSSAFSAVRQSDEVMVAAIAKQICALRLPPVLPPSCPAAPPPASIVTSPSSRQRDGSTKWVSADAALALQGSSLRRSELDCMLTLLPALSCDRSPPLRVRLQGREGGWCVHDRCSREGWRDSAVAEEDPG